MPAPLRLARLTPWHLTVTPSTSHTPTGVPAVTTTILRPYTVTARITDNAPPTPTPATYTATVYINTAHHSFDGHQPHHPLAAATLPDGTPLRLVFHTSDRIRGHETAAEAAYDVGNHQRADDNGQTWPSDIRSVSVGDVIKVTSPDRWIIHVRVDSVGFTPVPDPTTLVGLTGTCATSRH